MSIWNGICWLARPFAVTWIAFVARPWARLARPTDGPHVHTVGARPARLLLIGNGAVLGLGVASHNLALAGGLARELTRRMGRAVDIDIVPFEYLTATSLAGELDAQPVERYDGIVLVVGAMEMISLSSPERWHSDVTSLLTGLDARLGARQRAFVTEVPRMNSVDRFPVILSQLWDHQGALMNAQTRAACAAIESAHIIPFRPGRAVERMIDRSRETYDEWARLMAPHISVELNAARIADVAEGPVTRPEYEQARIRALEELHIIDTPAEERFDRLVELARDLFGTAGAALTLIDAERQWTKATTGERGESPRSEAFCNTVIDRPEVLVVEDASRNSRFKHLQSVTGAEHVRFYAGYPLESPDGIRVGAFCLFDTEPRRFTEREAALLRDLALRAQAELWAAAADYGVSSRSMSSPSRSLRA